MKKLIILVVGGLMLYGCASTGVVSMGPDTYMISKQGSGAWTSTGKLTAEIIQEANEYCLSNKRKFMPVSTNTIPAGFGRLPEAQLQFMCLTDNDYELQRPKMKPMPSTIDLNINRK